MDFKSFFLGIIAISISIYKDAVSLIPKNRKELIKIFNIVKSILQKMYIFVRLQFTNLLLFVKSIIIPKLNKWWNEFKQASLKQKFVIVRIPLSLILILSIFQIAKPYFERPEILYISPDDGAAEMPLDSEIEIVFSKPMQKWSISEGLEFVGVYPKYASYDSDESSIDFEYGKIKGIFEWKNPSKVIFKPAEPLQRDSKYRLILKSSLLSNFFIPMMSSQTEYLISFHTISNPKVVVSTPHTIDVNDDVPVRVIFDRPMIPLTTVENKEELKPAFTIDPPIEGEGRWLGTTVYEFKPSESYELAYDYNVLIDNNLKSVDGGELAEDFSWTFSSPSPRVVAVEPSDGTRYVNPNESIKIYFNQPVDIDSFVSNSDIGRIYGRSMRYLKGSFKRIDLSDNIIDKYSEYKNLFGLEFELDEKMEDGVTYQVSIDSCKPKAIEKEGLGYKISVEFCIKSENGLKELEGDHYSEFTVISKPVLRFWDVTPENGAKDVQEKYTIEIPFDTPMDENSFDNNLFITPNPEQKPSYYFSNYQNTLTINTPLQRSTKYRITINKNAKDIYGTSLGKSHTFSFTTVAYKPSVSIQPSNTYFGSFSQYEVPRIVAKVTNSDQISYRLSKLSETNFIDLYRKRFEYNYCKDRSCSNWQNYDGSKLEVVREWQENFDINKMYLLMLLLRSQKKMVQNYLLEYITWI